jgi:hypothetical protein
MPGNGTLRGYLMLFLKMLLSISFAKGYRSSYPFDTGIIDNSNGKCVCMIRTEFFRMDGDRAFSELACVQHEYTTIFMDHLERQELDWQVWQTLQTMRSYQENNARGEYICLSTTHRLAAVKRIVI